jgi:uncharacterized protein with PQ loop repeat
MTILSLPYTIGDPEGWEVYMLIQAIIGSFYSTPQIYEIYHNQSFRGVSIWTWIIAAVFNVTWTLYGLSLQDVVVTVSSALACLFATIICTQWLYYTHHSPPKGYHTIPAMANKVTRIGRQGTTLSIELRPDASESEIHTYMNTLLQLPTVDPV